MKFNCLYRSISILLLGILPIFSLFGQQQNGGVITLKGDTVLCNIASSPRDAGLKKKRGDAYFFDCVVAIFPTDSVRFLYPQHIRGFFFNSIEQNNPERYFSDSINLRFGSFFKNPPIMRPLFLRQLVTGGFYNLWFFEEADPGYPNSHIFILEETSTGQRDFFSSNKRLRKLLGEWPDYDKENSKYKDWFIGKQLMVIDFNKYKSGK